MKIAELILWQIVASYLFQCVCKYIELYYIWIQTYCRLDVIDADIIKRRCTTKEWKKKRSLSKNVEAQFTSPNSLFFLQSEGKAGMSKLFIDD